LTIFGPEERQTFRRHDNYARGFTRYERNMGVLRKERAVFVGASVNLAEALEVASSIAAACPCARCATPSFRYHQVPLGLTWPMGFD
jgi:hypothetical protein